MTTPSFNEILKNLEKEATPDNMAQLERRIHDYIPAGSQPVVWARLLVDGVEQLPAPVQDAVYGILCDDNNLLRRTAGSLLSKGGSSLVMPAVVGVLGTLVTGPVAIVIAAIVVNLFSNFASQDLGEEIQRARAAYQQGQPEEKAKKPAPRAARRGAAGAVDSREEAKTSAEAKAPPKKARASVRETSRALSEGKAAADARTARKKPAPQPKQAAEPKPAARKKTGQAAEDKAQPGRSPAEAKKPPASAPKAARRPTAESEKASAPGKSPVGGQASKVQPGPKATSPAAPKAPAAKKTAKKEKPGD